MFFNFGRYSYNLPLDLAERSLTNEKDIFLVPALLTAFTTDGAGIESLRSMPTAQ